MTEANGTDQVTLNVVYNRLVGICKEMGSTMMRAAYSPIFSESLDFSCVVFDRDGVMLAQSEFSPAQVGAIRFVVKWLIAEIGDDALKPGDVVVHNDPYRGGVHMPEHVVIKAVYHQDKIFGYVANIAHMSEIGGLAPGGFAATATEVYQEGLRLPPVWLMREGEYVQDIWRIIMTNHRAPRYSWGDLHAMLASLNIAERRVHELLESYGADPLRGICADLMAHSERWMRAEIAAIPDGEYYYEDSISNATDPPEADWFRLRVVIDGDSLIADFTGSDPQGPHVMNCTYGVAASAVYNAVLQIVDDDIPHNDGVYRPITVIAPPGTVVNVIEPGASVGGNTETHPRLWAIVLGALAQAVPERASASTGGSSSNFLFGGTHPHTDQYYVHYHLEGVGWGGRDDADGNSNQVVPNGNCPNTPVEIFETRYPFVQKAYRLRQDSGGPGRHRGGLSTERIMEVRTDDITVSAVFNGMVKRPRGIFGAGGGATSELTVKRAGTDEFLTFRDAFGTRSNSRFANIKLTHGDQVRIRTPGGGGFGFPWEREVDLVVRDVEEQFVSLAAARSAYGVAISEHGDDLIVDEATTAELRSAMAAAGKEA